MSDDKITHGQVTDSMIAFGKGATSSTRESRAATRAAEQTRTNPDARETICGPIRNRTVAYGRGSSATRRTRDGRVQERAEGDR